MESGNLGVALSKPLFALMETMNAHAAPTFTRQCAYGSPVLPPTAMFPLLSPLFTSSIQLLKRIRPRSSIRNFTLTPVTLAKPLPPRLVIPESDVEESFLKGSGPGGQKINKTSSAVQLKHLPTGLVVKSQETRSRSQNRKIARRVLGERLEEMQLGDRSRTALKADVARRKKASKDKKAKRKYRKLEEAKGAGAGAGAEEIEDADGDEEVEELEGQMEDEADGKEQSCGTAEDRAKGG